MGSIANFTERRVGERRKSQGPARAEHGLSTDDIREMLRMMRESQERDSDLAREDRKRQDARISKLEEAQQRVVLRYAKLAAVIATVMTGFAALFSLLAWFGPTRLAKILYALLGVTP